MGAIRSRSSGADYSLAWYCAWLSRMVFLAAADSLVRFSRQNWRTLHRQEGNQGTRRRLLDRLSAYWRPARQAVYGHACRYHHCQARRGRRRPGDVGAINEAREAEPPCKNAANIQFEQVNLLSVLPHSHNCYIIRNQCLVLYVL